MKAMTFDQPLSITDARRVLGDVFEAAFVSAAPVRIRRGHRTVRLVPEAVPEPVEVLPEGALTFSDERMDWLNSIPQKAFKP